MNACTYGFECCHCHRVTYLVTTDAATLMQTVGCLEAALGEKEHKSSPYYVFNLRCVLWQAKVADMI